jgi:hypothetical protein
MDLERSDITSVEVRVENQFDIDDPAQRIVFTNISGIALCS